MRTVRLVIPDLFLPQDVAAEVFRDLSLPALEKILARAVWQTPSTADTELPLENLLCGLFGWTGQGDAPVASIGAAFHALPACSEQGGWLRADPAFLRLQREQMLLLPYPSISAHEAQQFCAALNEYFVGQGLQFFAPHPQQWYVRLEHQPALHTVPLSQVAGRNVHDLLPQGGDALRWHQLFNEIQMLLFAHPLNEQRETQGEWPINSVWLWGGGKYHRTVGEHFSAVSSNDSLVEMLCHGIACPFSPWPAQWQPTISSGEQLLVWTALRLALQQGDIAAWREALQTFEARYAQPLWTALRRGEIAQLTVQILSGEQMRQMHLTRSGTWALWRRGKPLADYAIG